MLYYNDTLSYIFIVVIVVLMSDLFNKEL